MGDPVAARVNLQQMDALYERLLQNSDKYSAELVDIQRESVKAWVAWAEGKTEEALRQMRAAADREDATEKLPVTPGAIVPARELLGEMLLEAKQPPAALEAFESSLKLTPQRFNSLVGAARSAQATGDRNKAAAYYAKLIANCSSPDAARAELREARLFLNWE
jgi:tetratricopeptide (TPR) repeat protein